MKKKISELRVAELRHELEKRGLDSKGLKGALVQRLQKAVEEEGSDPSELEVSVVDLTSPKATGRRSVGRAKKSTWSESEEAQESIKQTVENSEGSKTSSVGLLEEVKDNAPEGQSEDPGDQENGVNEGNPDVASDSQVEGAQLDDDDDQTRPTEDDPTDDVRDVTPTRDEEGDTGSAEQYYDDEYDQPAIEEEPEAYEDVAEYDDDHDEYEEEAGNDFQHEDDNPDYRVEEEMEEEEYGEPEGEESEMMTVEEMAEHEESGAGDAVEEDYNEVDETGIASTEVQEEEPEEPNNDEKIGDFQHESPHEDVPAETDGGKPMDSGTTGAEKSEDDKPEPQVKVEQGGKEEVVSSEVDVLDMLDYDLELTGEQNNINAQQDDQSTKSNTGKTVKVDSTATTVEEPGTSDDHKAHPKPVSSKPSSLESARSGSQSSSKSASTTSAKDTGKTSASGKRETSAASKEENMNRNLWISGLSSTTRASELKGAFSRYGKVVGAKVVTNVKSPGSKCFGYVTMATADAASKCILHLNNTEMHGRMITVEIAKGDPSASSKKSSSTSSRKEAEAKDSPKNKDADGGAPGSSSRRQSLGQSKDGDLKDSHDSIKKAQDGKTGQAVRRTGDDERPSGGKSPSRSRPERGSASGAARAGDKRHSNRSPAHNRSGSGRNEPERKRPRPLDAADRKVVMDSNKGELRVNVSRAGGRPSGGARWEGDQKPKPLLSRRRSTSPLRRRGFSPLRSSRGGRGRGRGGLTRSSGTYGDRTVTRPGPRRDGQVLTMSQIRAQNRDRGRIQDRGGRGGMSRRDLSADRERLRREREERERLRIERERLERERRQLEKDRQERERLEAERIRLEQERKRELERIEREKAEMRRLQEITRYEVEQRQRAIKRTYGDDDGGHRSSRGAREGVPVKRSGGRGGGRPEVRRERDDNRRSYGSFNSRNTGQRNGPGNEPPPPGTLEYRSRQQGSSRDSGNTSKLSTFHDNRGRPQDRDDSRYGTENRSVEKYDRRSSGNAGGRSVDYQATSYDRASSDAHRRGAPTRDSRDGRKVVRERPNERGGSPPEYRRQSSGRSNATARIELTREQSPPVRRLRRDASPQAVSRNSNWRDGGKNGRETARRGDDRDLREQLRGSRQENYTESNRGQRRSSRSPNRNTSQYSSARWPDNNSGSSSQAYSASGDGNAIPTTGRSSGGTNWNQQWPQNTWGGAAMQSASAVNRQVIPPYGTVPSQSTMVTPGSNLIPAGQGYVTSGSDRQSRSFQGSSYNKQPIQRRF